MRYAKAVFERYKDKVKYWMTFNEINNQKNVDVDIFGWTCSGVQYKEGEIREEVMYQAVHHKLVASALAVKVGYEINPDLKIGCMVSFVPIYPFSCNPDVVMLSVESMHDRYLFADVHCRGHYPSYAKKERERKGYNIIMDDV